MGGWFLRKVAWGVFGGGVRLGGLVHAGRPLPIVLSGFFFRHRVGTVLMPTRCQHGTNTVPIILSCFSLAPCWHRDIFGTVLAPYWHRVSTVFAACLNRVWHRICTMLAPYWHRIGFLRKCSYVKKRKFTNFEFLG